ncbi:hypothetical protein EW146_g329 [Bondarzewia mesenterica]|uniref:Uncharacterized protein n=1 Tax=Bondarzewia mesenterica TaxID=1095465 RepID=A0A4S4M783_9AGAM|nr:hypothetical protein EW146_g329 [Bondarzewia mesenterica]
MDSLAERSSTPLQSSPRQSERALSQERSLGPTAFQSHATQNSQRQSKTEVARERFEPFDYHSAVVEPVNKELARDNAYRETLNEMFLDVLIHFHTWATARPNFENERASEEFEREINAIVSREREQGESSSPSHPSPSLFGMLSQFGIPPRLHISALFLHIGTVTLVAVN